jgi:leucyl aminopeptidase
MTETISSLDAFTPAAVLTVSGDASPGTATSVATGVTSGAGTLQVLAADARLHERLVALQNLGFAARTGEVAVVSGVGAGVELWFALGLGDGASADGFRRAGMRVGAGDERAELIAVDLQTLSPDEQRVCGSAFIEGVDLGLYRGPSSAGRPRRGPLAIVLHVDPSARDNVLDACGVAQTRAKAANLARELIDIPPSQLTPEDFSLVAAALAGRHGWESSLLGDDELERGEFGGILSVGKGSEQPSFLVDLTYVGRAGDPVDVVLVGKGVTMDCGGLNIKPRTARTATMKCDMAGGAAALATLLAVTELELPLNVRVLVPLVENLLGPGATLPGDVVRHRGGRTSEIVLTDAEGRVVLADAMAYATETSPEADVITIGTLCDGFGPGITPVVGEDERLSAEFVAAGSAVDEVACHVPLTRDYDKALASDVADAKNYSWNLSSADLVVAAAFMRPFANGRPWIYVDNADVTYLMSPWGSWGAGATGAPTRTLIEMLVRRAGTSRTR